jgi:hypothetical protein
MDDIGFISLVVLAQYHQGAIDPERIRHEFTDAGRAYTPDDILCAVKAFGFRAKKDDHGGLCL